jgi:iron(III) transport system permease protein
MLPPFVGAIGIQKIFGTYGILNVCLGRIGWINPLSPFDWIGHYPFWIMVGLNALSLYPILYLNILASLANVDPAMEEAASNLGCRGLNKFFRISLPLIRPGIFAGCILVFIWSFTELGVPLILNYNRITSVQIFNGLKEIGGSPFTYALVTVMFGLSVLFYALGKGLFGRHSYEMLAKASHAPTRKLISPIKQILCLLFFSTITALAILPHAVVIVFSFASEWYRALQPEIWTLGNYKLALGNALTIPSIQNSLIYASFATGLSTLLGVGIGFVVVRTRMPGRHLLDALAMMPLAVPGLVMAFGFLAMTQEGRPFAALNPIENPTLLLVIAYAIRRLPFMVRSSVAGLQQISPRYEEAAQTLGCPPFRAMRRITLPLITANLTAGSLLVFSQTMVEVSDSLVLAQKQQFYPITKAIYELMNVLGHGPYLACALGVWAMTFLAVTIVGASMLLGKNLGSVFRV